MGEVYRARDTKLNRDVALKILPNAFAADPERMARFTREARVLASLNHPNIAQIYGVDDRALVMELIEGQSLHGPESEETALHYARQIADALEAAHEKGITHRDLKPANIMVTPQGVVKVLDFGLAAVAQTSPGDPTSSPTLTISPTRAGVILGTAAYMSPEQARGKPVDKRADMWAFGVVLYEMLTGDQLFKGETVSDTLAGVLTKEPDLSRVPVKTQRLLRRCLEKDPKHRLRDIADAWALLDEAPQTPATQSRLPWAIAGALAMALAFASWIAWRAARSQQPSLQSPVRLEVDLGSEVSLGSERGADVILSSDGTRIVYVSQSRLLTRRLDHLQPTELAGTEGAYAPFFSPDGQWVAFFAGGKLKKVSMQGGPPIVLCAASLANGGSWGEDGNIIASLDIVGLSRISSAGGAPTQVAELRPGEVVHRWPQILPGGRTVLFTVYTSITGIEGANIEVMSLGDRRRKTVQRGAAWGRYAPSGHLVYLNNDTLFAVPFDPDRLEVRGTPTPVLERVAYSTASGSAQIDFSRTGTLVYRTGGAGSGLVSVEWLDSSGKTKPLLASPGNYLSPSLSPDGSRLALISAGNIWVYELGRDTMSRLTFEGGYGNPLWSPDGRYIVFRAAGGMFWIRADGAGRPQPLILGKRETPWSFTADCRRLAFVEGNPASGADLWTAPVESDGAGLRAGKPEIFLQTSFNERMPMFSPDGRWVAYLSFGAWQK